MGDVHMKVSIHTASRIGTRLAIARVSRVRVRVRVMISRPGQPCVSSNGYTHSYGRSYIAVCIAVHGIVSAPGQCQVSVISMPVCDDLRSVNST